MDNGGPEPTPDRSRWRSRPAVAAYVGLVIVMVVSSAWAVLNDRADAKAPGPAPTASPSAGSGAPGTPRITITLTPGWESVPNPVVGGRLAGLHLDPGAGPEAARPPVLLGGSGLGPLGYARLDPGDGTWLWSRSTGNRSLVGWSGSTAVFSGAGGLPGDTAGPVRGTVTLGLTPSGSRAFTARAGRFVTAGPGRVLLADGRDLTALTPTGRVAWTGTLPDGVTDPGRSTGTEAVFTSARGPGRVAIVDLTTGVVTTFRVAGSEPYAWITAAGVLVGDASEPGPVTSYDARGRAVWSLPGSLVVQDVVEGYVLVADAASADVRLVRLSDGRVVWTSLPDHGSLLAGRLTLTPEGVALVMATFSDSASGHPEVIAVDPVGGEQLWAVESRQVLATWHGFALLADPDGRALTALDLATGISYATLNASATLTPATTVLTEDTLVYLDAASGTAHAVRLSDKP